MLADDKKIVRDQMMDDAVDVLWKTVDSKLAIFEIGESKGKSSSAPLSVYGTLKGFRIFKSEIVLFFDGGFEYKIYTTNSPNIVLCSYLKTNDQFIWSYEYGYEVVGS